MRPKRIYVNSKTLQKVTAENHAGHTMRVKAFASKQDVEYTDLSQVWHTADEEVNIGSGSTGVVYQCEDGSTDCFYNAIDLLTVDRTAKPKIVRWAYVKDLLPEGGAE